MNEEPEQEEATGNPFDQLADDELAQMRTDQQRRADAMQEAYSEAAEQLQEALKGGSELSKYNGLVLMGYRLVHWAVAQAAELEGVTTPMAQLMLQAQEHNAQNPFDFAELVTQLEKEAMPWLKKNKVAQLKRQRARKKTMDALQRKLKRKDIPLPLHSMRTQFDEDGFTHRHILLVFGPREAVQLVTRLCAREYQRCGGVAGLLSAVEEDQGADHVSTYTMPPNWYRNAANVYGDLVTILEPMRVEKDPAGLIVIDSLDELLLTTKMQEDRPTRLARSLLSLMQYQANHTSALIVGVELDADMPVGADLRHAYPEVLLSCPHVQANIAASEIVGVDSQNLIVGNDLMTLDQARDKLQLKEEGQ